MRNGCILARREYDRAKPARIMQSQQSVAGFQLEVVMGSTLWQVIGKHQAARHAQMDQQQPL